MTSALLKPALGTLPGFRAHLKHPLPELPRIVLGLWALSLPLAEVLTIKTLAAHEFGGFEVLVLRSLVFWSWGGLGLCAMVWLNPWPGLGMRTHAAWRSALGDLVGLAWIGLLGLLPLYMLLPVHADYVGRLWATELMTQAVPERDAVAQQLQAGQPITRKQMQLPSPRSSTAKRWLGIESDGRIWLYRSDLPVVLWLTPQRSDDGVLWACQGLGARRQMPMACRDATHIDSP